MFRAENENGTVYATVSLSGGQKQQYLPLKASEQVSPHPTVETDPPIRGREVGPSLTRKSGH